jgi:hypothetical protein
MKTKARGEQVQSQIKKSQQRIAATVITITNADLEAMHAIPRLAVNGGYGKSSRLVWQHEGFIFVDELNAVEVY